MQASSSDSALLERAVAGDHIAFAELIEPHRRAVFRHCYRMLGSGPDAEDATQDAFERSWRRLATFDGSGPLAAWLHRIATNVCLDHLRLRRARRDPMGEGQSVAPGAVSFDVDPDRGWVEPVSSADLGLADEPGAAVVRREEVSLAFVAALQRLAPRQRAALLLIDVLGFTNADVSEVLGVGPSAVNSLLSRAREGARSRSNAVRVDPSDERVRLLLDRYVNAWQLCDVGAFLELVTEDVRFTMPPMVAWIEGGVSVGAFLEDAVFGAARPYGVPLLPGWCNGQPAFATYEPGDDGILRASGLQVLELEEDLDGLRIAAIVSFRDGEIPLRCGLPPTIAAASQDGAPGQGGAGER